ncbi:MAG: plasmid mobilization protein [Gemmatimonadaceae bacterium]
MEKAPTERRECSKLIRFTSTELEIVSARAQACGRPVACYIRDVSIGGRPRAAASALSDAMIRELARVAVRLGELRDIATAQGLPQSSDFGAAVEDVVSLIRRIA